MNGVGMGQVKRMYPGLGIGTIEPDDRGPEVIFTDDVVASGRAGFDNLRENDRVRNRVYPDMIAQNKFAEYVERA